jgi:hypothetical protein
MTLVAIIVCVVAIGQPFTGARRRYRRHRGKYEDVAAALCEPGSWHIRFYLRTLILRGKARGHRICYSVFGDERKNEAANSYLLLEYPVRGNFRFYGGSDPDRG